MSNTNTLVCDRPGSLLKETQKLLKQNPDGVLKVAMKSGVPFYWLRKFAAGKIPKPSVNRVEFLHKFLSSSKA